MPRKSFDLRGFERAQNRNHSSPENQYFIHLVCQICDVKIKRALIRACYAYLFTLFTCLYEDIQD